LLLFLCGKLNGKSHSVPVNTGILKKSLRKITEAKDQNLHSFELDFRRNEERNGEKFDVRKQEK